jgi:competence protein ComFC
MMMILLRHLIDFLFPKSDKTRKLESMNPEELLTSLSPAVRMLPDIHSLYSYNDPSVHEILWQIKYQANKTLVGKLALKLIETSLFFSPNKKPIVTFIPATQNRKEKRGFDQGKIILDTMRKTDEENKCEYIRDILSWKRNVTQQSLTKNREERFDNMNHAFICLNPENILNRIVIVLDDVSTTGATLYDAKRALEDSGASRVYCVTIAH